MPYVVQKTTEPRIVRNWPVVIPTALDGGKIRKDEIFVDYEILLQSEADDIGRTASQAGESGDKAILLRTVKAINGMVDDTNNPIPFNDDTLADALERVNQRLAMTNSFWDVMAGRKPARKNS